MILLADGGSTKVDWCLIDNRELKKQVFTQGANPFFRSREDISEELKKSLVPGLGDVEIESVHFFGAGCAFPEKNEIIRAAIADNLPAGTIEVDSDLLAAAKGLCGRKRGIACMIGTGSNSCYYDGEKIAASVSPLGYVLGDEGSGAVLGRLFLGACLKNQLTKGLKEKFMEESGLSLQVILDRVYRQPLANRFLADLSPFIVRNMGDESVYRLVYGSFKDFFVRNVMQYDYKNNDVHFTGSIAYHFADVLRDVATGLDIRIGAIEKSPMKGLISYYSKQ
ncbi:MAG: ATPase [Tannerella sp.]|jgi:N-acetylglucosamine kinase-like BadF-type ATPase|nr:ATPase [Tannerella sp.]